MSKVVVLILASSLLGCAGLKVIHPNHKNENEGMKQLDLKSGTLVDTYTCQIVASNGQRVSGTGTTEEAARSEAVAKCRDKTLISFCDAKKAKCTRN